MHLTPDAECAAPHVGQRERWRALQQAWLVRALPQAGPLVEERVIEPCRDEVVLLERVRHRRQPVRAHLVICVAEQDPVGGGDTDTRIAGRPGPRGG